MLDLRRVRYFIVVARERNFTRAAERLHIAQPALSRQVRQLEDELGVELLHRTTHSVELTEAGRELLERGSRVIDDVDALWRTMRGFGSGALGSVVVAYGTSAGYDTAPRLLRAVGERLPELELATRVLSAGEIIAGLADGSVDVGVVRCPPEIPSVEQRLLRLEPQGLLVRADHRLAGAGSAGISELSEPVLLHPRSANPGHYDAVTALIGDAPVELRDISFDLAQTPVAEGRAVAIVGESTRAGLPVELAWVPLEPAVAFPVKLVARSRDRPPAVERLLAAAEAIADELGWRTAMP
jgi:DNA-binding transcriptional LysR family regulator